MHTNLGQLMSYFTGLPNSQIASSVFTLGTAAVLPFYTLMVVAPKAQLVSYLSSVKQHFVFSS